MGSFVGLGLEEEARSCVPDKGASKGGVPFIAEERFIDFGEVLGIGQAWLVAPTTEVTDQTRFFSI